MHGLVTQATSSDHTIYCKLETRFTNKQFTTSCKVIVRHVVKCL